MKNIAFIHSTFPMGGAERVSADIAAALCGGGYKVYLLAEKIDEAILRPIDRRSMTFVELPDKKSCSKKTWARTVAERLRDLHIDCCIIPIDPMPCMTLVRRIVGPHCKFIFHDHGMPFWWVDYKMARQERKALENGSLWERFMWYCIKRPKERVFKIYTRRFERMYRRVYAQTDRFVVLCEGYRRTLESVVGAEHARSKIRAMLNPLSEVAESDPEKRHEVLYVGRMSYEDKRIDRLLRIWARVQDRFPDWELKLVGDGPERGNLERMASELALQRVQFCGFSTCPSEHYDTAAILCMTSTFEGWGLVLAEAQASGVVPIAYGCSDGVRELLGEDGTTGIVIEPFDEEAYVRELAALMEDSERRRRMQPAMKARAAEFSPEACGRRWIGLLQELATEA